MRQLEMVHTLLIRCGQQLNQTEMGLEPELSSQIST